MCGTIPFRKLKSAEIQCVQKKRPKCFFCSIFYKTWAILMKFDISFPEQICCKMLLMLSSSPEFYRRQYKKHFGLFFFWTQCRTCLKQLHTFATTVRSSLCRDVCSAQCPCILHECKRLQTLMYALWTHD